MYNRATFNTQPFNGISPELLEKFLALPNDTHIPENVSADLQIVYNSVKDTSGWLMPQPKKWDMEAAKELFKKLSAGAVIAKPIVELIILIVKSFFT